MSAHIVQDKVINDIVSWCVCPVPGDGSYAEAALLTGDLRGAAPESDRPALLGQALFALNVAAVEARYGAGQAKEFRPLNYKYRYSMPYQGTVYAACERLLYQCSEGDIPETELFGQLTDLYNSLAHKIVRSVQERRKATA